MGARRETYLDLAKFLAIYLVVVHHVRDYAGDPTAYAAMAWLENLSSVFPVAVFFAVSGYLARGMLQRGDVAKFARRTFACLWPVFSILCVGLLQSLWLYGRINVPEDGWVRFAFSVGWFFFCLVVCEALTLASFLLSRVRAKLLPVGIVLSFLVLWITPVGLFHALEMIPFYWFGVFVLPRLLTLRRGGTVGIVLLTLHFLACILPGDFGPRGLAYHTTAMHLQDFTLYGFLLQLTRMAIGILAAGGTVLTLRSCERAVPYIARLAFLGTQTLGVFFVHMLILIAYYARIGWTGGGLAGRLGLAFLVFLLAHFIVVATRRFRWTQAILWNPLSLFTRKAPAA